MTLDEIPEGSRVFVATNIFLYAGVGSKPCAGFLHHCRTGKIEGFITQFVLSEFCHRRMLQEARLNNPAQANLVKWLNQRPWIVQSLREYALATLDLLNSNPSVISFATEDFQNALQYQKSFGLLTNDSLNLAAFKKIGIKHVASADKALNHVPDLLVYHPTDLEI